MMLTSGGSSGARMVSVGCLSGMATARSTLSIFPPSDMPCWCALPSLSTALGNGCQGGIELMVMLEDVGEESSCGSVPCVPTVACGEVMP